MYNRRCGISLALTAPSAMKPGHGTAPFMQETASGFQFTEASMELLRKGDKASEDALVVLVFGHFSAFVRYVQRVTGGSIDPSECEDVAMEFISLRLPKLMHQYNGLDAKGFSKIFYTAMRNFALDWARKLWNGKFGRGNTQSADESLPGGEQAFIDICSDEMVFDRKCRFEEKMLPSEFALLLSDIRNAIRRYTCEDEMKSWVLEASLMAGMKKEEVARKVPDLFSGKVYASGSVYSLVSRFRESPELLAVVRKWMAGSAWAARASGQCKSALTREPLPEG